MVAVKPPVKFVAPDTVPPVKVALDEGKLTYVVADIVVADNPPVIMLFVYKVQLALAFNPQPIAEEKLPVTVLPVPAPINEYIPNALLQHPPTIAEVVPVIILQDPAPTNENTEQEELN